jgi:hypothetical protein
MAAYGRREDHRQENTRKHLSEIQRVDDWDCNFLPPAGIPGEVFATEHNLKLDGVSLGPEV